MNDLTNEQKAIYAILADNVYWDVRKGFEKTESGNDFTNSNWTPVPNGWTIIAEQSGSGDNRKYFNGTEGFTARAYQNDTTKEVVISFAGTQYVA